MEFRQLGRTDIKVSKLCIGSMTWGEQNTEAQGHEQLDYAVDQGINFIDTAELYAIPRAEQTYGETERIIGSWLTTRRNRDKVVLASKAAGPMGEAEWIRGGDEKFNRQHLTKAIEDSLKRCQTDYFDLYQLHWPERDVQVFGRDGATFNRDTAQSWTPVEETLEVLQDFVKQGKIRTYGLSNETAWGTMHHVSAAERLGAPRPVSIQNAYSLLNRTFENDLAEVALFEDVGLLAYSPLASGLLTGKYRGGAVPPGSRLSVWKNDRYFAAERAPAAVEAYFEVAQELGISLTTLAMAFVNDRAFVTSNIFGATTMDQLKENVASAQVTLSDEVLKKLDAIQIASPNPCP